MKKYFLMIALITALVSCKEDDKDDFSGTGPEPCIKTGAVCKDAFVTSDTGSNACADHDGVKEWICSNR